MKSTNNQPPVPRGLRVIHHPTGLDTFEVDERIVRDMDSDEYNQFIVVASTVGAVWNGKKIEGMKTGQGEKVVTEQGATRESRSGRGRFDLIPYESMEALAIWSEQGAIKYGDRNWEKGLSVKDCISRMIGHALKAGSGWTDEDHLAAVMWNASAAITMMKRRPDCNDHIWIAPEVNQEEAVTTFPRPKWTGRTCGCGNKEFTIEWHLGSTDFDVCTKCGTKHPKNGEEGIDPMEVSCKNCGSGNVVIGRNNRGMVTYVSCDECKWMDKYE